MGFDPGTALRKAECGASTEGTDMLWLRNIPTPANHD